MTFQCFLSDSCQPCIHLPTKPVVFGWPTYDPGGMVGIAPGGRVEPGGGVGIHWGT